MDTETLFINHDSFTFDTYVALSQAELETVQLHIEIERHLQEIQQLFCIFQYNIDNLQNSYTLKSSGAIFKGDTLAVSENDFIAVNALVINIISSGKTLIEALNCYINEHYPKDNPVNKDYFKFCRAIYDSSFAYRLLMRLRDYSQHGHLPVSIEGNKYCLHLYKILHRPHFNLNTTIKHQLSEISEEIIEKFRDTPTLSLTLTIAEYVSKLVSIYVEFLSYVKTELELSNTKYHSVINSNPQNTFYNDTGSAIFVYELANDTAHAVAVNDDIMQVFNENYKKASDAQQKFAEMWEFLKHGIIKISIDEERSCIEIDGL